MPIVHMSDLLTAESTHRSLAAFNVITLEHAQGVVRGAERAQKPVILQLSENAIAHHGGPHAIAAAIVEVSKSSSVDVALHLDHVTEPSLTRMVPELGFSSVMFDGSKYDFEKNCVLTRQVADWGRNAGIWIEAELGEIGGKDGAHAPGIRTDPGEAVQFVIDTQVDSLAVAVGSSHAMLSQTASLDLDLVAQLKAVVPVPLVLHGSSGVPDGVLTEAARTGISKINIGTALNVAFTDAIRSWLTTNPTVVDPRKYLAEARNSIEERVAHYIHLIAGAQHR